MKRQIAAAILGFSMIAGFCPPGYAQAEAIEIHVSPGGKSTGAGTLQNPVDSLEAARKLVRTKKSATPDVPINVIFHEGTYRFDSKVSFDAKDSGSEKGPITYMAASGEEVYFKGSKVVDLTKIKLVEDAETLARLPQTSRGKVGYIDLAAQGFTNLGKIPNGTSMYYTDQAYEGTEVYLDDKQQTMARWPNGKDSYDAIAAVISKGGTGTKGAGAIFQTNDYRLANWVTAPDAWVVGFLGYDWSYDRIPIKSIDSYNKQITLEYGSSYGVSMSNSHRWAVINLLEELDIPGEWYIDHDKGYLYYYPERTLKDAVMEITTLGDDLISLDDTDYVNFRGITFAQTRGCAIKARNKMEHMTISDCVFENMGRYGIWHWTDKQSTVAANTTQASQYRENGFEDVHIDNNVFRYIGRSAFNIYCGSRDANIPSGCTVNNNYLAYIGEADKVGYAATINGVGCEVKNNTVHESGYGLLFIGCDIELANNEIYNVVKHVNDASALYTGRNFINRGNKIHDNYLHDLVAKDDLIKTKYGHGIYLDDMDSGTEIYHNIIWGTAGGGVWVNCGMSNTVRDNVFISNTSGAAGIAKYGIGLAGNQERMQKQGENALLMSGYDRYPDIKKDMDTGRLSYPVGNVIKDNISYEAAFEYSDDIQAENTLENNNEIAKEEFVDADGGDYRLTAEAAEKYGTSAPTEESFDYLKIGIDPAKFEKNPLDDKEFKLISPANGAKSITDKEVTFTWQACSTTDRFHVVIATDRELKNVVHEAYTYERIYTTDALERGKVYYWKVFVKNESVIGEEWESAGVVHTFSLSENSIGDINDIKVSLAAAKQKLDLIKEGDAVGLYKPGTRDILKAEIEKAEKLLDNTKATEDDKRAVVSNIEDIIDSDNFINGGYVNLGDFFSDTENWVAPPSESVTLTDDTLEMYSADGSVIMSYNGFYDASRILSLKFKLKVDFNADETNFNSKWISMGLRSKEPKTLCYGAGNDCYFILMKQGQLEYQRNSGGVNTLLETVKRDDIKSGEWMDIDFGVVNLGNVGQLTILKINGEVAYQAVDSSEQAVMNKGAFQLTAMKDVKMTIKPADDFNDTIDELMTEYTFKMTEDFCKSIEEYNTHDTVVMATGSKKAYFNNKLGDISAPIVGGGSEAIIPIAVAAEVFGGSVSGNTLTVGGASFTLPAGAAGFNLNELAAAIGKKVYCHFDEMYLISDAMDMHTANYGELLNSTLRAMKLYSEE